VVDLFLDRARAAAPGFRADGRVLEAVEELGHLLGGLPLAIELAAASITRIDVLSLVERIRDQPRLLDQPDTTNRHHSLADVIESTYRLLVPAERRLADQLATFVGPFPLDLAEHLARRAGGCEPVGATLGALVDKSLVLFRPGDHRYELLPPVRAVCRMHIAAVGELDALRGLHARVVLEGATRIDRALRGRDEARFATAFDDLVGELRAATRWFAAVGDPASLLELSGATHWFSALRTRSELYRWAESAVEGGGASLCEPGADRAWASAANGAAKRGDLARARHLAELGICRIGAQARYTVETLAQVELFEGNLDAAVAASRCAAQRHLEAGDRLFSVDAAGVEAAALAYRADQREAEALARRLHREATELGVASLLAMTCYVFAETQTEPASAAELYQRALDAAAESRADFVTGLALTSLAALELRNGRPARARARLRTVLDHWQRGGIWNQQWLAIRLVVEALDAHHEYEPVATLVGAYDASSYAGPAYGDDARRLSGAIERAREQLGDDRYDAARRQGMALSDERAVAFARSCVAGHR
jgi:hypothetical protein